ncbi:MAG: TIGR04076 family protein [Roseivirga sp.]|nr:TIGR04076 family protein [Roseivirga sp.]
MSDSKELRPDQFELYDLTVVVEKIEGKCTCEMAIGDCFHLKGGKLSMPEGKNFCLYALQSTLPLLPAKQRRNHPADWMETDSRVICPDPACQLVMRIDRDKLRVLNHDDVSPIEWDGIGTKD